MTTKTIPLEALKDTLMLAIVRNKDANMHLVRFAVRRQAKVDHWRFLTTC